MYVLATPVVATELASGEEVTAAVNGNTVQGVCLTARPIPNSIKRTE